MQSLIACLTALCEGSVLVEHACKDASQLGVACVKAKLKGVRLTLKVGDLMAMRCKMSVTTLVVTYMVAFLAQPGVGTIT